MTIFDVLTMIGGLCLFLFGMTVMGDGLERRAGNSLKALLAKLTGNKIAAFLTGLGITAVIQPGGSKNDQLSIDACDEAGIAMIFVGDRHFKH